MVGQDTIVAWAVVPHSGLENRRCKRWVMSQSELSLSLLMENLEIPTLGGKSSSVTCLNRLLDFSKHITFHQSLIFIEACRMLLLSYLADGRIRTQCLLARFAQKSNPGFMKFPSIILLLKSLTRSIM